MRFQFPKTYIVAHRGASGLVAHENTIEAFQKAIDIGCDCIECDIRRTLDNIIIVFHDAEVNGKLISALTYEELLKLLPYRVPTLEETLLYIQHKILIDIEFKESGYEEEAIALIKMHLSVKEFFVRSFLDKTLKKIKEIDKNIITALLLGAEKPRIFLFTRLSELFPLFRIIRTKCDYVSPYYKLLRAGFLFRMRLFKIGVSVWTINDERLMKKYLIKKKVDAIITDYPDKALEILSLRQKEP